MGAGAHARATRSRVLQRWNQLIWKDLASQGVLEKAVALEPRGSGGVAKRPDGASNRSGGATAVAGGGRARTGPALDLDACVQALRFGRIERRTWPRSSERSIVPARPARRTADANLSDCCGGKTSCAASSNWPGEARGTGIIDSFPSDPCGSASAVRHVRRKVSAGRPLRERMVRENTLREAYGEEGHDLVDRRQVR